MKNMKLLGFSLFIIVFMHFNANAQCDVTANIYPSTICAGQAVTLTSTGGCGYLMSNDFNNGTPGAGWTSSTGVSFTNPCGVGPDAIYLWMGDQVPIPRTLTTIPFDVVNGCEVRFWMKFAVQSAPNPCEGPDLANEGVSLQYSTNGSTWTDIIYFRPDGVMTPSYPNSSGFTSVSGGMQTAFTSWAQYTFPVPPAAISPNTSFRWIQHAYTSLVYDHWGVDVVEILCPSSTAIQWSHGPTVFNPPQVFPMQDTCYIVTVTDTAFGSGSASDTVCVTVNPVPTSDFNVVSPICSKEFSTITYTGDGDPGATYNWSFSGGQVISGTGQGPYEVKWTNEGWKFISLDVNQNGCNSTTTFDSVLVNLSPTVVFTGTPTRGCMPLTVDFTDFTSPQGSQWSWSFGDGAYSSDQNPTHTYTLPGQYSVNLIVETDAGCADTLTRNNFIEVYGQPIADFTWSPEVGKVYDPTITFYADVTYASAVFWDFGYGPTSTDFPPVTHTFPDVEENYTVTLIVTNEHGCNDTISKVVQIIDDILEFPNVITPNADGLNDYFVIVNGDKYPGNKLVVFNRWGKKVFEQQNYDNRWDGGDLVDGTYFYIFTYLDKEYHGSLTILRGL
jgi:gliding motility-associated-like protein